MIKGEQNQSIKRSLVGATCLAALAVAVIGGGGSQKFARAQDLLRNSATRLNLNQQNQQMPNNNAQANNPLANIQLPPQLAALTPQQLHQLAQIREAQLQQEAAAAQQADQNGNNGQPVAPAPIGLEAAVTPTQPTPLQDQAAGSFDGSSGGADSSASRHDESGAYGESSGTEVEGTQVAAPEAAGAQQAAAGGGAPTFEVNWNKCPQLEPSESEKSKKTQVITKCLQSAPIPTNLTRENVEAHREQIATCALKIEGWFDDQGNYKYDKAESEIRAKKLESQIELQVLKFHVACKDEANKKFPRDQNKLIDQVQFYQACMDYYISIVCEIEVSVDQ